jgi:hypothetical protein
MKGFRPPPPMPALAKQPSTRPYFATTCAIASRTAAGLLTSQTRASALPPALVMVSSAAAFFFSLRPQIDTAQP